MALQLFEDGIEKAVKLWHNYTAGMKKTGNKLVEI